jgi:serine/threonine-protein kinase RsbW
MSEPAPADGTSAVTLVIPASNDHIRFARLVMSTIASKLGFDYDTIDDLRIAVDELCASVVILAPPGAELTVIYQGGDDGLRVEGRAPALDQAPDGQAVPGDLSLQILAAVVDDHAFEHSDGSVSFSFFRRLEAADA